MSKKTLLISFVLILLVTFWDSSALNTPSQAVVEVAEEQVSENVVDDTDADDGFTISAYDDLMQRHGK